MEDVIEKARLLTEKYIVEPKILEKQQICIDANNPNDFSFSLDVEGLEYILVFGSWHQPFDKQEDALFVFEKCLSGEAQLRVVTGLNISYKGTLEIYDDGVEKPAKRYVMMTIASLFLFLFPKKEKVYRNSFIKIASNAT